MMYGSQGFASTGMPREKDEYLTINYNHNSKNSKDLRYSNSNSKNLQYSNVPVIIGLILSALGILVFISFKRTPIHLDEILFGKTRSTITGKGQFLEGTESVGTGLSSIDFSFYRDGYDTLDIHHEYLAYKFLADYDAVIEPFASTYMTVNGADTSKYYEFEVCVSDSGNTGICEKGSYNPKDTSNSRPIGMKCKAYDELTVNILQYDSTTNEQMGGTTGSALCMYVRREIRALTEIDRNRTLDALATMWKVSEAEGQQMYGENYHDAKYLLDFHHFNSAWQDSDHIHEGNGFLLQHIKMTNIVEIAMQAVDPAVSLPYWDFTQDANMPVSSSTVFTAEYFGSMNTPSNPKYGFTYSDDSVLDAAIPDGRWAYIKADMNDKYPELKAGYGYMRAPWNMNPSPYVSRFNANMMIGVNLPSCNAHYEILEETDFMTFLYNFQNDPHATAHSMVGGTYGCDLFLPLLNDGLINDEDSMLSICSNWVFFMKEFYRYDYISPSTDCSAEDPDNAPCGFTCTEGTSESLQFSLEQKVNGNVPTDLSQSQWDTWVEFVCSGDGQRVFSGDQLESASPSDPSFWPIHPTLERLVHAKFMAGGFDDYSWNSDVKEEFVCAKSACYEPNMGSIDYYDDCCKGHFQYDQMMDAISGNRSLGFGPTNDYIVKATDPTSTTYSMPYIYDTFSWDHCENDFDNLLYDLYQGVYVPEDVSEMKVIGDLPSTDGGGDATQSEDVSTPGEPTEPTDPSEPSGPTEPTEPSGPSDGQVSVDTGAGGSAGDLQQPDSHQVSSPLAPPQNKGGPNGN
jgi:hypothetical protein